MKSISKHLDYQHLYKLWDSLANQPFRMSLRSSPDMLTQGQSWALVEGKLQLNKPLIFDAKRGRKTMDILWGYSTISFFFSSELILLLQENGITGWGTYPVELYDRQGELLVGYWGIAITGPECTRDRSRSQIVSKPPPVAGGQGYQVYRGLYFDEADWDGSDMFWVSEGGGIVVTERVYKLFKKHKIRNVELTPLLEVELAVSNDKYGDAARKN